MAGRVKLASTTRGTRYEPGKCVFLNCPFDADYEPLLDALIFATACCGMVPRSALESVDLAEPRIHRILNLIFSCKYSLHDLSRCRGEGEDALARFNMPLELGMAIGRMHAMDRNNPERHVWTALVPTGYVYQRVASDLAGYDPIRHDQTAQTLVPAVVQWLSVLPDAGPQNLVPRDVLDALPTFYDEKARLQDAWPGGVPWGKLVEKATEVAALTRLRLAGATAVPSVPPTA